MQPASESFENMTTTKRITFWGILVSLPFIFVLICVELFYLYGYLTFPGAYCGSFAKLDNEIGWVLKPDSQSCVIGKKDIWGEIGFQADVFIDSNGFRVPEKSFGNEPEKHPDVIGIGDSWTFGYGVEYEESFVGLLQQTKSVSNAILASPAYSGVQSLLLAYRKLENRPKQILTYFEFGFWERGICHGRTRPESILKPCYWVTPDKEVELLLPDPEIYQTLTSLGIYPGGMVGAGEKTLSYFLLSRPLTKLHQVAVKLGLASGFANDFHAWGDKNDLALIRKQHLKNLIQLAEDKSATLLLVDAESIYDDYKQIFKHDENIIYVNQDEWEEEVMDKMNALPKKLAYLPNDGHFALPANKLITGFIVKKLEAQLNDIK